MPANSRTKPKTSATLLTLFHEYIQARWLMVLMAISLVSGLYYYYFAPPNWNAAQIALGAHLLVGTLSLPLFIAYVRHHLPWGLKVAPPGRFRKLAWSLLLLFAFVLLSGLVNATPFFLYLLDVIWFPEFETFDLVATLHLLSALALPLLLVGHLALRARSGIAEPSDAADYMQHTALTPEEIQS